MAKIKFDGDQFTVTTKEKVTAGITVTVTLSPSYSHNGGCTKKWEGEYDEESSSVVLDCKHCGAHHEFSLELEPEEE